MQLKPKTTEASHTGVPHFLLDAEVSPPITKADILAEVLEERDRYRSALETIVGASLNRKKPQDSWALIQQLATAALKSKEPQEGF